MCCGTAVEKCRSGGVTGELMAGRGRLQADALTDAGCMWSRGRRRQEGFFSYSQSLRSSRAASCDERRLSTTRALFLLCVLDPERCREHERGCTSSGAEEKRGCRSCRSVARRHGFFFLCLLLFIYFQRLSFFFSCFLSEVLKL